MRARRQKCTRPWNQRTHSILATTCVYLSHKVLFKHRTFVQLRRSAITYFSIIVRINCKDIGKKSDLNLACKWNLLLATYVNVHQCNNLSWKYRLVSRLSSFCPLALINLSIFAWFSKLTCRSLSWVFVYQTKHISLIYLVSKLSNGYAKLCTFYCDTR